jgi:hypothetical protein
VGSCNLIIIFNKNHLDVLAALTPESDKVGDSALKLALLSRLASFLATILADTEGGSSTVSTTWWTQFLQLAGLGVSKHAAACAERADHWTTFHEKNANEV